MTSHTRHRATDKLWSAAATAATAAAVAIATGAVTSSSADGSLVIDLRATELNGAPLSGPNSPKVVSAVSVGDVVTFKLFAVMSGTNGVNDEQVQGVYGSILSAGPLLGPLSAQLTPPFNGLNSQNGLVQDLDGDTDLDVGSGPNGGVATHFFFARANVAQGGTAVDANSEEIEIGTATFTVTGTTGHTFVNFARRANASGGNITTAATWFEDGVPTSPIASTFGSGAPVLIGVPEPTGLATTALAALGLMARRRQQSR